MNFCYEDDKARELLSSLRMEKPLQDNHTALPLLGNLKVQDMYILDSQYPPSMRLTIHDGEDEVDVVTRVQAVLCGMELGPFTGHPCAKGSLTKIRGLRQHVKLTSLGNEEVNEDFKKLASIEALLIQHAAGKEVLPMDFIPFEVWPSIEEHARYFTDRALSPFDKNIAFNPNVDPNHVLAQLQPEQFIHGPDIVVEYHRRVFGEDGDIIQEECSPAIFKAGDLVEIAFSIIGVPIKDNRVRLILLLRGIILLNDVLRKESELSQLRSNRSYIDGQIEGLTRTPKRPAVYLKAVGVSSPAKRARREVDEAKATKSEPAEKPAVDEDGAKASAATVEQTTDDAKDSGGEVTKQANVEELKATKVIDSAESDGYDSEKELGELSDENPEVTKEVTAEVAVNENADHMQVDE